MSEATARVFASGRGRRWLNGGHPWLFENDVARIDGEPSPGDLVAVIGPSGETLGSGFFSPASKLRVRLVARGEAVVDREFWRARIAACVARREVDGFGAADDACRVIGGDAEGFPGFVADRYADALVVQCGTPGADRWRDRWLEDLSTCLPGVRRVVDRSDVGVRRLEALEPRTELLRGSLEQPCVVRDMGMEYEVDLLGGHKTGHYLDQRDNRRRVAQFSRGKSVLDVFSYDGLFGVRAALAGAERVLCLDQSARAGERSLANAARNGVADRVGFERVDAMKDLRARVERGERWGVVVLDPPAFARNKREIEGALRGYRELNRRGMELVESGGILVSASCSHAIQPQEFLQTLREAAAECGRSAWCMGLHGASSDHPASLTLPESSYLKCAIVRVA